MLRNGLFFIAHQAALAAHEPLARTYRQSLILGSLREDVIQLPLVGFTEYPSFSHFGGRGLPGGYLPLLWPGPGSRVSALYRHSLAAARRGRAAAAFVALGRAAHVLSDVSIPSHVHRAAHDRDPFEWWIEGNLKSLAARSPAAACFAEHAPRELVHSMAVSAARFAPDRTNTPLGRALKRRRLRSPISSAQARTQALELIPLAVSHVAGLVDMACRGMLGHGQAKPLLVVSGAMRDEDDVLEETLGALDLPERMLKPWLDHNRAFCDQHGGRRVYEGLLALLDRCDVALERRKARGGETR